MKKNVLLLIVLVCAALTIYGQEKVNIDFTVIKKADVRLGKQWNYEYNAIKTPIKVTFSGTELIMVYNSGKTYWKTNVVNYKTINEKENVIYILKVLQNDFVSYVTIIESKEFGAKYIEIKIPYIYKNGVVTSYVYYQSEVKI